jgi:toxin ParE1/3/4
MPSYGFHPDALLEYAESTSYYAREASPEVAERFVASVESGIAAVLAAPERWRVVDEPGIRRYILRRFPYVLYYRWAGERITVYAVMHSSRAPGYWRDRIV